MRIKRKKLQSALFEFLVVFLSVVLALLADDWRTNRDENNAERTVLEQLASELDADASDMQVYMAKLEEQRVAASTFMAHLREGAPDDSLVASLRRANFLWNYKPTYPTYQGLSRSGDLSLISDADLRRDIVSYHEDQVDLIGDFLNTVQKRSEEFRDRQDGYLGWVSGDSLNWEFKFYDHRGDLINDYSFQGALGSGANIRELVAMFVRERWNPANQSLSRAIREYLETQ